MFKLVVLSSVLALARGSGLIATAPLAYSSTIISPATTSISKQFSSVVHPSPLVYHSTPLTFGHYLRKRSVAPLVSTYSTYGSPLIASPWIQHSPLVHSVPLIHSTPLIHAAPLAYSRHYLKKRSVAPLAYGSFIAPTAYSTSSRIDLHSSPLISAPLYNSASFIHSAPLIHSAHSPLAYSGHYLKKRSVAPLALTSYIAPSSYSHQSRIDLHSSPYITSHYTTPLAYSTPLGFSHIY